MNPPTPIPLPKLLPALGNLHRWRILAALSQGEPRMVKELAQAIGRSADATSKHLALLRDAGLVTVGRGNLYSIPAAYIPTPGQLDLGPCLLRMDGKK